MASENLKNFICPIPFEWLEVHGEGKAFLCCPSWLPTPIGTIGGSDLSPLGSWNGTVAKRIRHSILDGSYQYCNHLLCPSLANPTHNLLKRKGPLPDHIRKVLETNLTELPWGPRTISACYDRTCNLACPSCRRDFVSETGERRRSIEQIQAVLFQQAVEHVEMIKITGSGDPFASPSFRELLKTFSPGKFPNLKRIHLFSNGLLWTEQLWQTMPTVHPFVKTAEISVDAASEPTYALNRRGGDWKTLLRNLEFIGGLKIELSILSFVVQHNNFLEMPAFVELADRFGFQPRFWKLSNWGTFTAEEYLDRAVHLPNHRDHSKLLEVLRHPSLQGDCIRLTNLSSLGGTNGH